MTQPKGDEVTVNFKSKFLSDAEKMKTKRDPAQSKFFKHHYRSNWHNKGIMVREIDVIREIEGW